MNDASQDFTPATPVAAKTPAPLVSDDALRRLTAPGYDATRGEFDAETRAFLAMALPEIARELLWWRDQAGALALSRPAITTRIEAARRLILSEGARSMAELRDACTYLQQHSRDAGDLTLAREVIAALDRSAVAA